MYISWAAWFIFTTLCHSITNYLQNFSLSRSRTLGSLSSNSQWPFIYFLTLWICLFWIVHTSEITYYLPFRVQLISIVSWSTGVTVCLGMPFPLHIVELLLIPFHCVEWTTFYLPTPLLVDTWAYFYRLVIVNIAAMNIHIQVSLWVCFQVPRSHIAGSYSYSVYDISRSCQTVLHSSCTIYILTSNAWEFQFLYLFSFPLKNYSHPCGWSNISL